MKIKELKDVQEKYDFFLMIYEQGVKEYVPFYKVSGVPQGSILLAIMFFSIYK